MPEHDGHRQRLKDRFVASRGVGVADYELVELLLTYAIPRRDVKPIAKALMAKFKDLNGVMTASHEQLVAVEGMGAGTSVLFEAIGQMALRARREKVSQRPVLDNKLALLDYLYTLFEGKVREEFHVLFLDSKLGLIADETMFTGTLSEATVGPRELVKRALEHNAAGLIVAHNHPSGKPQPSAADDMLTAALAQACAALGVVLHDHVIVGAGTCYAYRAAGKL